MVVALLVNQLFPSSRGLETQKSQRGFGNNERAPSLLSVHENDGLYQDYQDVDQDGTTISRKTEPQRRSGKRKPFRAMALLTSLASDFDVVSDWVFFLEARFEDNQYRQAHEANGSSKGELPYLVPPFLLGITFVVCCIGTFMWLVLATDGRLVAPILRSLGHDTLSMGHILLLCVLLEDLPQVILTFLVEEYYEEPGLSNYAVYTLLTSLYDTLIKLAEAFDERNDIVETGDWLKESISAHKDTVTSVLTIPLPASTSGDSTNGTSGDNVQSVRGRLTPATHRQGTKFSFTPTVRPQSLRFLTTSLDKTIRLWETTTSEKGYRRERCTRVFRGHLDGVTCICILGDPNYRDMPCRRNLDHHDEETDETTYFITGCKSGNAKMWNLSGDCIRSYYVPFETEHDNAVTCVTTVVEGNIFACGYQSCSVRLWEAWTGILLAIYRGHDQPVTCLASMLDETTFVSGSFDGSVKLWNSTAAVEDNRESVPVSLETNLSTCSSETPVSTPRASNRLNNFLSVAFSGEERTYEKCFQSRSNSAVLSVACVEPEKLFMCGYADAVVRIWSVDLNQCLRSLVGHEGPISAVLSIDRSTVLTGSHDTTVKIWDAVNGVCLRTYEGNEGKVSSVTVAQDNTTFLTAVNQTVKVWVISSVPPQLPENETLDQILESNLGICGGYEMMEK